MSALQFHSLRREVLVSRYKHGAFTLIEIMVSVAILAMIVVLMLSIVDSATKLWRQNENRVDSYREARAAANLIAADLATIVPTSNTNLFQIDTTAANVQSLAVPGSNNVFFLTEQSPSAQEIDNNVGGNLCAVGYFLAKETGSSNAPRDLYRYFRSSKSTLDDCLSTPGTLIPTALSVSATDNYTEMLARNITSFRVQSYTVVDGKLTAFDQKKNPMPDLLEIQFTALNDEVAKRITDWSDTSSLTYKQNARTFSARVRLDTQSVSALSTTATPSPTP